MMKRSDKPISVADVLEAWADGHLTTARAISLAGVDGFADLLEAAIGSRVPLRRRLLPHEERQAASLTELLSSK